MPEWLDDRFVRELAPDRREARRRYRAFVEKKIDSRQPLWDQLVGQIYLGRREWVEKLQLEVIDTKPRSDEHSSIQRCAGKPQMPRIVEVVAEAAGVEGDAIRHGRGGATRMLVAWLGWYEGMKRLRKIAAALRLRSTGHVSNLVRRCDEELRSDPVLQRIADEALAVLRPPPVVAPF